MKDKAEINEQRNLPLLGGANVGNFKIETTGVGVGVYEDKTKYEKPTPVS